MVHHFPLNKTPSSSLGEKLNTSARGEKQPHSSRRKEPETLDEETNRGGANFNTINI